MGVEPFLVASSLTLVVAQRLVRRVCANCAAPYTPSARTSSQLLGLQASATSTARPRCAAPAARTAAAPATTAVPGVFEVLPITAALRAVLLSTPTERALSRRRPGRGHADAAGRGRSPRRTPRRDDVRGGPAGHATSTRATAAALPALRAARSPRTWWSARGARRRSTGALLHVQPAARAAVADLPVVSHRGRYAGLFWRTVPRVPATRSHASERSPPSPRTISTTMTTGQGGISR